MNNTILALYQKYLDRVNDPVAAASLVLADVMLSRAGQVETTASDRPLTVKEAAARLHVSPETIYGLVAKKELSHHRVGSGRSIRFRLADLEEYQRRMTEKANHSLMQSNPHRL